MDGTPPDDKPSTSTSLLPPNPSVAHKRAAAMIAVTLEHPAALYLASLAMISRRSVAGDVRTIASFFHSTPAELPWERFTFAMTTALRSWLVERYKPSTANRHLATLRGVLRFAVRLGRMSRDAMLTAVDVAPVRGVRLPAGRHVATEELAAMLTTIQERPRHAARDSAVVALLWGCGLRRHELAALDYPGDINGDLVHVRHGKGDKEREVPMPPTVAEVVRRWLFVRGTQAGPLFLNRSGDRLGPDAVYRIIVQVAEEAEIPHLSPHDLRRTCAGDLFDAGVDVRTIAKIFGHSDIGTTGRYDRRAIRVAREAAARLVLPGSSLSDDEKAKTPPG